MRKGYVVMWGLGAIPVTPLEDKDIIKMESHIQMLTENYVKEASLMCSDEDGNLYIPKDEQEMIRIREEALVRAMQRN